MLSMEIPKRVRRYLPRFAVMGSLALGLAGCGHHGKDTSSERAQSESCIPNAQWLEAENTGYYFDDPTEVAEQVRQMPFFTTAKEYNDLVNPVSSVYAGETLSVEQREERFKDFLKSKGITVDASYDYPDEKQWEGDVGPNEKIFFELAFIPLEIINASGLKVVKLTELDPSYNPAPSQYDSSTLALHDMHGMAEGLAAMVLNNFCTNTDGVLVKFKQLTEEAGHNYNPSLTYPDSATFQKFTKENGHVFLNMHTAQSAHTELIYLLSRAIKGHAWYSDDDPATVTQQKEAYALAIFNRVVQTLRRDKSGDVVLDEFGQPMYTDGDNWQALSGAIEFNRLYTTHPHQLAVIFGQLSEQLKHAKTWGEKDKIFKEAISRNSFEILENPSIYISPPVGVFSGKLPLIPRFRFHRRGDEGGDGELVQAGDVTVTIRP